MNQKLHYLAFTRARYVQGFITAVIVDSEDYGIYKMQNPKDPNSHFWVSTVDMKFLMVEHADFNFT